MPEPILKVDNLKTWFDTEAGILRAVDGISFEINRGETVAMLGESGCGKSMTALSLLQLVPEPAGHIESGNIWLNNENLLKHNERAMRSIRGRRMAMIFQEPQSSLNPVMTVGAQVAEVLPERGTLSKDKLKAEVVQLFEAVGMADPAKRYHEYPHQLSGGMRQRVMIAIALASQPDILIADEPTTALDVTIQAQILDLLKQLQRDRDLTIMLITHDLGVVANMAHRVLVMYAGEIVESATAEQFFAAARHPYSQKLFRALPGRGKRGEPLEVIPGSVPPLTETFTGCRFVNRCELAQETCQTSIPAWIDMQGGGVRCHLYQDGDAAQVESVKTTSRSSEGAVAEESKPLLMINNLKVHFPIHKGVFKRIVGHVRAVDGVSLSLKSGRTVALVGESGCGKTTVGKGLLQLIRPTDGQVMYHNGQDNELTKLSQAELRPLRSHFQIVFQDPYSSLNPRMLVSNILQEGMKALGVGGAGEQRAHRVQLLLEQVGLPAEAAWRYPHEFSGGQRQRISIARALAVEPRLIVCDEPTSALDVSVQAQILNLLKQLQDDLGLSYLFITHDLSVVEYLAHEVAVMYLGRIVESGSIADVMDDPRHPYTQALLAAIPKVDQARQDDSTVTRLAGDIPSPSNPPRGCHFHPRCPRANDRCRREYPESIQVSEKHYVSCHLFTDD